MKKSRAYRSQMKLLIYILMSMLYEMVCSSLLYSQHYPPGHRPPKKGDRNAPHQTLQGEKGKMRPSNFPPPLKKAAPIHEYTPQDIVDSIQALHIQELEDSALQLAKRNFKKYDGTNDLQKQALTYAAMALAHHYEGHPILVMEYLNKYFDIKHYRPYLRLEMAKVMNVENAQLLDLNSARNVIKHLNKMSQSTNDESIQHNLQIIISESYLVLAKIYRSLNREEEAFSTATTGFKKLSLVPKNLEANRDPHKKGFRAEGPVHAAYLMFFKRYREAATSFKDMYEKLKAAGHSGPLSHTSYYLSRAYYELGMYDSALHFIKINLSLRVQKTKNEEKVFSPFMLEQNSLLADIYSAKGLHELANEEYRFYYRKHKEYEENRRLRVALEMRTKYESDQQEADLAIQRLQLNLLQNRVYYLIAGIILVILLALVTLRNYLQKQKANLVLAAKNHQISTQSKELSRLSKFKDALSAMIVHDLKNPLNSIIGLSKRTPISDLNAEYINSSGRQMLNLVLNILDIQKFEEAKVELSKEEHAIAKLIEMAIQEVKYLADERWISFKLQKTEDFCVNVDPDLLLRMLVNVLSNAIKYSQSQGTIDITLRQVGQCKLRIGIKDYGHGIPAEQIPHVFDKFWQANSRKSGGVKSVGLGLTFCKLAAEAHDGQIEVQSEYGQWTEIEITIPFERVIKKEHNVDKIAPPSDSSHSGYKKPHISRESARVLQPYLEQLRVLRINDLGEIWNILQNIDESREDIKVWKEVASKVVISGEELFFHQLLDIEK